MSDVRLKLAKDFASMLPAQFDQLVFAVNAPTQYLSSHIASDAVRAVELLRWAGSENGPGLAVVQQMYVRVVTPSKETADDVRTQPISQSSDLPQASRISAKPILSDIPPKPTLVIGRDDDRQAVVDYLVAGGGVVLHGMGGVGKSTLANLSAREAADHFPGGGVWIDCTTHPTFADVVLIIAAALIGNHQTPTMAHASNLARHLGSTPCLLVLDNFEAVPDDAELRAWLASITLPSACLITSREKISNLPFHHIEVPALFPEDARDFFLQRASMVGATHLDVASVDVLCKSVEYLPLAIELLAATTGETSIVQLTAAVCTGSEAFVDKCIGLSYEGLPNDARRLLDRLSLPADGIGEAIVEEYTCISEWRKLATQCVRASLLKYQYGRYRFHGLVRRYVQANMAGRLERRRRWVAFAAQFAEEYDRVNDGERFAAVDAERRNLVDAAAVAREINDRAAEEAIGRNLGRRGHSIPEGRTPERVG